MLLFLVPCFFIGDILEYNLQNGWRLGMLGYVIVAAQEVTNPHYDKPANGLQGTKVPCSSRIVGRMNNFPDHKYHN